MSIFSVWSQFGFRENPYDNDTLEPNEEGHLLLSGRDEEVQTLIKKIASDGTFPTLEGRIGVGKTSLINVAAYRMLRHCRDLKAGELWLPAVDRFQPLESSEEFERRVYFTIAQTLVKYEDDFEPAGLRKPNLSNIRMWLNSAEYGGWQVGGGVPTLQASFGRNAEPNTGEGFAASGFPEAVRLALNEAWPGGRGGGIICVVDNLEFLETAGKARHVLSSHRDRVFRIPQLRWVLCGARGLVSRARSEHLSGIFQPPLIVGPLPDKDATGAIRRRIEHFGNDRSVAPVTPSSFEYLYKALNSNMREALAYAQEFSHWLSATHANPADIPGDAAREQLFRDWLLRLAKSTHDDAKGVQQRHWKFFDDACTYGGRFGSSTHAYFDFNSQQQMTGAVTALMNANLMSREVDPDDGTRTINSVTAMGWLVKFYLDHQDEAAESQAELPLGQ